MAGPRDRLRRRLQPRGAAEVRRHADRAGEIAAEAERRAAARDRRRLAAARAAGRAREIPRIARAAEDGVLAVEIVGQLGDVRLAEHDRAGALPALDRDRVGRRHEALEELAAVGRAYAGGRERVLDRDRQALERAAVAGLQPPVGGRRLGAGALGGERDDRVQPRVDAVDVGEVQIHQLRGRDLPCTEEAEEAGRGGEEQSVVEHGRLYLRRRIIVK